MIDVATLTRPLSAESPCGENLEYDADFQALEVASRGKPEQQFGGKDGRIIPAEEPAWSDVRHRALALFERTRDLRVAVLLTRALTRSDGLGGLSDGLAVIRDLVDAQWAEVHPKLDPEEDNDPVMRVNTLAGLADANGLLRDLRAAEFLSDPRLGRCSVRQVEVALGIAERGGDEPVLARAQIEGALRSAAGESFENHAMQAIAHVQRIADVLNERVGVHQAPDLKPLIARLRPIAAFVNDVVPPTAVPAPAAPEAAAPQAAAAEQENPVSAVSSPPGAIRNRDDVIEQLGRICEFLERTEPTNPAPLLIRRAQRLMTMTFVDILRDVAPEGVASISNLAGLPVESK